MIALPEAEDAQEARLTEIASCVQSVLERVRVGEVTKLDNVEDEGAEPQERLVQLEVPFI